MKNEQYLQPYRLGTPSNLLGNLEAMGPRTEGNRPNGKEATSFQWDWRFSPQHWLDHRSCGKSAGKITDNTWSSKPRFYHWVMPH